MASPVQTERHRNGELALETFTASPDGMTRPTPILFIHGAWHGAWCWVDNFLPFFASKGYSSTAVSLRGHGGSDGIEKLQQTYIEHYLEDVLAVARVLELRFGRPPVLVGHSMGGFITAHCLERIDAPAAVLLAAVPPHGMKDLRRKYVLRHPLAGLLMTITRSPLWMIRSRRVARDGFFSRDTPEEIFLPAYQRIQNESIRALEGLLDGPYPRPDRIRSPVLVVGGELDNLLPASDVHAAAAAFHTEPIFIPGVAHDLMLDRGWERVAERMLQWFQSLGL